MWLRRGLRVPTVAVLGSGIWWHEKKVECFANSDVHSEPLQVWRPGWQLHKEYRLELNRELGSGGYGEVYLAVHKTTGVSRAVKRVRRDNREADEALQKERDVMWKLKDCDHVVKIKDAFVDNEYRYLVLELCFGLDLVDSIIEELSGEDLPGNNQLLDYHENVPHVAAVFRYNLTLCV